MAGQAPLQDLFALQSWGGGTDEFGNPSYTQVDVGAPAGSTPITQVAQQLQQSGALTPASPQQAGQGFNVNYGALPKVNVNGQQMSVAGFSPWASPQQSDSSKLHNANALVYSPDYGWLTPSSNIKDPNGILDKIGNAIPSVIGAVMAAAIANPELMAASGTFGGTLASSVGGMGGQLFNTAENAMQGNKINPLSLLSAGAGAAGLPGGTGSLLQTLGGLAQGKSISPLSLVLSLGRLAQGGGS